MTLQVRQLTDQTLTFNNGKSLHWADVQGVTWLGETKEWLVQTQTQRWQFKRPFGWLGVRLDAAIYALPHSQAFWGSTATARIPAEVIVWFGVTPQSDPQRERQMLRAQLTDWVFTALMWSSVLFGLWLYAHHYALGILVAAMPILFQILRYRSCDYFLETEEQHVSGLSVHPESITLTYSTGQSETLPLADLQAVKILTFDNGPFGKDLFFVLEGMWGVRAISGELDDCKHLFDLFNRLPNFDHQGALEAMGSTENTVFNLWNAPQGKSV